MGDPAGSEPARTDDVTTAAQPDITHAGPGLESAAGEVDLFAAAGITVTEGGKRRARARRLAVEQEWTREKRNALRRELGLPPQTAE